MPKVQRLQQGHFLDHGLTINGASTHHAESPVVSGGDLITLFAYLAIASCCCRGWLMNVPRMAYDPFRRGTDAQDIQSAATESKEARDLGR